MLYAVHHNRARDDDDYDFHHTHLYLSRSLPFIVTTENVNEYMARKGFAVGSSINHYKFTLNRAENEGPLKGPSVSTEGFIVSCSSRDEMKHFWCSVSADITP